MTDENTIIDISGAAPEPPEVWEPLVIGCERIEEEIDRLASIPRPANGRREALFVHPRATGPSRGLAPGIQVTLSVLLPGEQTDPVRQNSTSVNFSIRGTGTSFVGDTRISYAQYDVFNVPSFVPHFHVNDSDSIQVRLTYSNAPLLEAMRVHFVEENPTIAEAASSGSVTADPARTSPFGIFQLNGSGAMLMPYELLINPPAVESPTLHWPWLDVKEHLDQLDQLGASYVGRRLYLLYNPMTGRTNGTTPSFFATMTIRPPGIVDRPHRHVSAAINYYFRGDGYSRVAGRRYEWKVGDLMFSAPGWAIHNHASGEQQVYELTVQDQPLNIAMESLLWQENLKHPPVLLGAHTGFSTNRAEVVE